MIQIVSSVVTADQQAIQCHLRDSEGRLSDTTLSLDVGSLAWMVKKALMSKGRKAIEASGSLVIKPRR